MINYFGVISSILLTSGLFSQKGENKFIDVDSSKLSIVISNYIEERQIQYPKFKDYGYVTVNLEYYNLNAGKDEIKAVIEIKDQYKALDSKTIPTPVFETVISDKIILFHLPTIDNIQLQRNNKRKIKRLIKRVNKSLGEKEHIVARNSKGEIIIDDKDFRKNESFNIHGGIELQILANGEFRILDNLAKAN